MLSLPCPPRRTAAGAGRAGREGYRKDCHQGSLASFACCRPLGDVASVQVPRSDPGSSWCRAECNGFCSELRRIMMDPMSPSASSESIASEFELLRLPPRVLALPSSASTTMTHSCLNAHRFLHCHAQDIGLLHSPCHYHTSHCPTLYLQPCYCGPAIGATDPR